MYYRLLSQLKNAAAAKKDSLSLPFSNMDNSIAKILVQAGFLRDAQKKMVEGKERLEMKVAYQNRVPIFSDFRIVSKPSRRIYQGYKQLKPVRHNFGIAVLSTPEGIMTNKEARKHKVGGEYLFQIW